MSDIFRDFKFLVLPNRSEASVTFRCQLIENYGGIIASELGEVDNQTLVLVNESFFIDQRVVYNSMIFKQECDFDFNSMNKKMCELNLPCYPISIVSEWIKNGKIDLDSKFRTNWIESIHSSLDQDDPHLLQAPDSPVNIGNDDSKSVSSEMSTEISSEDSVSKSSSVDIDRTSDAFILENENKNNEQLINALTTLYNKYSIQGDSFRSRSYRLAITSIKNCLFTITSGEQARTELDNIGVSIASKIQIILNTGKLPGLGDVDEQLELLNYFMNCHGVGAYTAKRWATLNMKCFHDIVTKLPDEFITEWNSLFGWAYYEDWSQKIPRIETDKHFEKVKKFLSVVDPLCRVEVQGSYKRGGKTSGDIDLLFYKPNCDSTHEISQILEQLAVDLYQDGYIQCILQLTDQLYDHFEKHLRKIFQKSELRYPNKQHFIVQRSVNKYYLGVKFSPAEFNSIKLNQDELQLLTDITELKPEDKFMSLSNNRKTSNKYANYCRRMDFFSCKWSELGAARIQWCGNEELNRWLRIRANNTGLKLSQHGLFRENKLLESFDEEKILNLLNVSWIPYHLRRDGLWEKYAS